MNSADAKRILIAHRDGHASATDADVIAALEQTRRDPALAEWWQQQAAFHAAVTKSFASIPVPERLREQIGLRSKVVALPWWRQPRAWAAAAAVAVLLGLAVFFLKPEEDDTFSIYRSRMVSAVLRQYRMEIKTNDMAVIRQFLATRKAPSDYAVPPGASQLQPVGAGVLSWQASPVSMVCLDSGGQGVVFLFVVEGEVKKAPGPAPEFAQVNKLTTASWTEGGKVYLLAFQGKAETVRKFL